MTKNQKVYKLNTANVKKLIAAAVKWGDECGVDNLAVLASCMREAAKMLDSIATEVGHGALKVYDSRTEKTRES
jgi:hypothetical protein